MMRHRKKENPTDTAELAPVEATASAEPAQAASGPAPDPGQPADSAARSSSKGYVVVAIVYLLGIFMGAIDMNIVNPARTVIQNTLSVSDELGVWLMTIYTLAYAASIPVMGKLADRHGRKYIYQLCVLLFGVGSLLCGLSQDVGSFEMLIASRAIQAIGGGGIMPVATAEFGTAFPPEKRGMALGLVGGIYGVASVLGSTAGSFILDVAGSTNWQFIFYVNIPICLFILVAGLFKIPNTKEDEVKPIDGLGTAVLTVMVLSLMYGLKNIDFFELSTSIMSTDVYPFLLAFLVLVPVFIAVEHRAADPIMNLAYFKDRDIVITLLCSITTGIIMMGTLFAPQFCENAMMMRSGSGGYFLIILGVFTGFGAPLSGKLIDKIGVKPILAFGFLVSVAGSLFMAFVTCEYPTLLNVCISMALSGLGIGFIMGTPLNYMMLAKTDESESNSALATLSLVRSIGTAIAPAIMVAFIAHAGLAMQDNIMEVLPTEVTISELPYAEELDQRVVDMKADEDTADMLDGVDIPKMTSYTHIEMDMSDADSKYDVTVSDEMKQRLQDSDVTTIVATVKDMSTEIYGQIKPQLEAEALQGIDTGLDKMNEGLGKLDDSIAEMKDSLSEMGDKKSEMTAQAEEMDGQAAKLRGSIETMNGKISTMQDQAQAMKDAKAEVDAKVTAMQAALDHLPENTPAEQKEGLEKALAGLQQASAQMQEGIDGINTAVSEMKGAVSGMEQGASGIEAGAAGIRKGIAGIESGMSKMKTALAQMNDGCAELADTIGKMEAVKAAIPDRFDEGGQNYLAEIDEEAPTIQKVFQQTLNEGFKGMFILSAICSAVGVVILAFYRDDKHRIIRKKG